MALELRSEVAGRFGLIDQLRAAADEIDRRWRVVDCDEQSFPDIAAAALARLPTPLAFDLHGFVRWALARDRIPLSASGDDFGEPPITVLVGDSGFKIDVLFWLDGTTTIHQHMFSGAFRLLAGSSVHGIYRFAPERRINSRLQLGALSLAQTELLETGDTRAIQPGSGLIHSLFHLDRPSVTLVARTRGEDDVRPQFQYLRPGIAIDPQRRSPDLAKKVQLLRMMRHLGHPGLFEQALFLLRGADLESTVRLLLEPQLLAHPAVRSWLAEDCPHVQARAWLLPAYDEAIRMNGLVLWRSLLVAAEHRFLLALLMNVSARGDLLGAVERRYGGEPVPRVMRWIDEILEVQALCPELPPLIDIPTDQPSLAALRCIVEGSAGAADATVSARVRASVFLRPLVRDA